MAIQLQFRRGTTAENNIFIGAPGEVTMDVETNQMRIHDGEKLGGYIIGKVPQTNNLLDIKWSDHILNDIRWLRSDTFSWQDGSVYQGVYNHLSTEYNEKLTKVDFTAAVPNLNLGDNTWLGLIYNGSKYVAIGSKGYVSTSTDGSTWTAATLVSNLGNYGWGQMLAYNGSIFVAVTQGGNVSTSTDGTTWSARTLPSTIEDQSWRALIYDGSKFILLNNSGWISTSTDGTTWTTPVFYSNLGGKSWMSLIYVNGKYLALSYSGYISTSTDCTDWTAATQVANLGSNGWMKIVYDGTKYIALSYNGYVSSSIDGENWTEATQDTDLPSSNMSWDTLIYDGTKLLTLSNKGYLSTAEVSHKDTISGITVYYYIAEDGHKICSASEEGKINSIFTTTGVAWYYIIDTTNRRFKLPRTQFGFTGIRDLPGKYIEAGLPNITGTLWVNSAIRSAAGRGDLSTGCFYGDNLFNPNMDGGSHSNNGYSLQHFDASRSSKVYGNSTTVQPNATQMYLYFYVGEYTQTAVENTAGITSETINALGAHAVVEAQLPTAANNYTWYRKYADGWVEQGGWKQDGDTPASVILPIPMNNTYYCISTQMIKDSTSPESGYDVSVRVYNQTTSSFWYQLAVVSGGTGQGIRNWCWEVKGMAA